MAKWLTDEEVIQEIEKLRADEDVKLARKKTRLEYRQRQVLYQLRDLKKKGTNLRLSGFTLDNIESYYQAGAFDLMVDEK